ncbi:MAG: hypothetical protein WCK65_14345, partial [Rhodospirillaceae bacterium]
TKLALETTDLRRHFDTKLSLETTKLALEITDLRQHFDTKLALETTDLRRHFDTKLALEITDLRRYFGAKFDTVNARLDGIDKRQDNQNAILAALIPTKIAAVGGR